jgi:hypothetical protein
LAPNRSENEKYRSQIFYMVIIVGSQILLRKFPYSDHNYKF